MLLGMAVGRLKQSEEWALHTDINLIIDALKYHDEDLLKANGIWPEVKKPRPGKNEILDFARTQTALVKAGKIKKV